VETVLQTALYVLAAALYLAGLVGCVVPVLPGPLAAYAGFLCLLGTPVSPGWRAAVAAGILAVAVTVLDTLIPGWGAKKFSCSRWGMWGSVIGALLGSFFFPLGILVGPFAGAVAGELVAGRRMNAAAWSGLGAFLGFWCGVGAKLLACGAMAVLAFLAAR